MSEQSGAPVLAVRDLVKHWKGASEPILHGLSLAVAAGTVAGVRGRNGSGKTTLLRIAAGLIAADSGAVRIAGLDPERDRRGFQRRVGFVSAGNGALYARLTVDDHLALWSRLALLPTAEAASCRAEMLEVFALHELQRRRLDRLSTGQRQRLRLALGFLHQPDVVLLDEPAVSLDESARELLEVELSRLRERGGAAVVCGPTGASETLEVDHRYVLGDGRLEPS